MTAIFFERVGLRNYKSIAQCDIPLGALTYLVCPNGSGKSNFLDALHLVKRTNGVRFRTNGVRFDCFASITISANQRGPVVPNG